MRNDRLRMRLAVASSATVAAGLLAATAMTATTASAAVTSDATRALPCHAWMSNSLPPDYTSIAVHVTTADHAQVTMRWPITGRSTGSTLARANSHGNATIWYYISGATPGYRVAVSVSVREHGRTGACSTSFLPHHR